MIASACGDDGDDDSSSGAEDGATTTAAGDAEPVAGGDLTVLLYSEIRSVDPVNFTGSGGSDAQQAYAIYGALLTRDTETNELEPKMADSVEPNAEFTVWTIKIHPNIKFSDGTAYDAAAVKAHWERIKNPANRSPAFRFASGITAIDVVDTLTVRATLAAPNAHFDRAVERTGGMNYIPSPAATATLGEKPVGAGPFLFQSWLRDDRMELVKNPNYFDAPQPYIDRLTFRVITDEDQRLDTLLTGQADLNFTATDEIVSRAEDEGLEFVAMYGPGSPVYAFNLTKPPFDDVRVRTAFVQAIDRQAMVESAFGADAQSASGFTEEGWMWHTPDSAIPEYDPEAAQELFDEVAAEKGGPVQITLTAFQQSLDQLRADFIQASISQLDNVDIQIQVVDQATGTLAVLSKEFNSSTWGFPYTDPEPGLYDSLHSKGNSNYTGYNNPDVDKWLEAAHASRDEDIRRENYDKVFAQVAKDLPWYPYAVYNSGFLVPDHVHDVAIHGEYVLNVDEVWVEQ
jgi:peptide/nickel transport system substrate-binding protein